VIDQIKVNEKVEIASLKYKVLEDV
jgi:hypothetical protein